MMQQRFRQAFAGEHAAADLRHHRTQAPNVDVDGEQIERIVDARAGLEQQRQIAGENRDVLGACGRENSEKLSRTFSAPARFRDGFDRDEAEIFDAIGDFRRGRRGQQSAHQFATLRQSAIAETRHVRLQPWSRGELPRPTSPPSGT